MANKRITDVDFLSSLNGDESFFVNQNNAIKQIDKNNIVFGVVSGGTGADTIEGARENLDVYSKSQVNDSISALINFGTITIQADKWEQNDAYGELYYANMEGLVPYVDDDDKSIVIVSPSHTSIDNFDAYVTNGIKACEQSFETINFIADTKPETNIIVNYVVLTRGGSI